MQPDPKESLVKRRSPWSEDQTIRVLEFYLETNGSSIDENNPEVVRLAAEQDREPASIAMKLANFRFLDPVAESKGIKGMSGVSKSDVSCWNAHSPRGLSPRSKDFIRDRGWASLLEEQEITFVIPNNPISRALLTKPFLILTGPSGTGKTRGAVQLARGLCESDCMTVVAVGADWTDNRHVVGFLNPLQTEDGSPTGTQIYETTPILDLLLHANANPDQPHVLILDEMNLSHVERYFSDFLSAMELEDKEKVLKLHSAATAITRDGVEVAGRIDFPVNLFVIGTVNIDETTYMFSPKVLDRANVIEIHAEETELKNFLRGITDATESEERDYGISFLDVARVVRNDDGDHAVLHLPETVKNAAADRLMELFNIMKRGRGEFGFRTGREVLAYLRTAHFLTPEAERTAWAASDGKWIGDLDVQILQKILPKLHGSRARLAPLLGALATYCGSGNPADAMEHFPDGGALAKRGLSDARNITKPQFPKSYQKLERMIEVLVEEQFVSFIC